MKLATTIRASLLSLGLSVVMIPATVSASADDKAVRERISETVRQASPGLQVQEVNRTPIPGVREVLINGDVFYFSEDGRYMLQGELLDLKERRSLTEQRREGQRAAVLGGIDADSMLIYRAAGKPKHVITVVTDIDCPYCRRFHEHMADLNARGVEVRYLLLPRAGVGSESYRKAVSVWCADKPLEAMTAAKQGKTVPDRQCEHQVDRHMALSQRLGVTGTPAIITDAGGLIAGYLPPDELLRRLGEMGSRRAGR